jgi:transcriptional regulator with XRE-family HTH domain
VDARASLHDTRGVTGFGQYLRRLRRARGLTQERLAELSGLSPDTIRRLEHAAFSPSLDTLSKVCEGMQLSLSTLFTGFELAERINARELTDLLASRSPRDYRMAYRVLRTLFDELDGPSPSDELDDEDPGDAGSSDDGDQAIDEQTSDDGSDGATDE